MRAWLQRRKVRRFHRQCNKLGIPRYVRERLLKCGAEAPD